jgi:hypothetical protein
MCVFTGPTNHTSLSHNLSISQSISVTWIAAKDLNHERRYVPQSVNVAVYLGYEVRWKIMFSIIISDRYKQETT